MNLTERAYRIAGLQNLPPGAQKLLAEQIVFLASEVRDESTAELRAEVERMREALGKIAAMFPPEHKAAVMAVFAIAEPTWKK